MCNSFRSPFPPYYPYPQVGQSGRDASAQVEPERRDAFAQMDEPCLSLQVTEVTAGMVLLVLLFHDRQVTGRKKDRVQGLKFWVLTL